MTARAFIASPDVLDRRVLFAVELVDPITQALIWRGLTVTAAGIEARPIISLSGRFVWLIEQDHWPATIAVDPGSTPYSPHSQAGPPRPPDITNADAAARLVRIVLRPTAAYPFDTGATIVRGTLKERVDVPGANVVAGALVQLAWHDALANAWQPAPPQPAETWPETDSGGAFAALLQLHAAPPADPDLTGGLLKARVQVTRGSETRATPDGFLFLPDAASAGRVPEGRLLTRDVTLGWEQLVAI